MNRKNSAIGAALLSLCLLALPGSLSAQTTPSGSMTEKFKSAMMHVSQETLDILQSVKSAEDVEKVESRLVAAMDGVVAFFKEIGSNVDTMTPEQMNEFQNMQSIMRDRDFVELNTQVQVAGSKLRLDYPEAAAKLEEIAQKHSQKMMEDMMAVAMQIQQKAAGADAVEEK